MNEKLGWRERISINPAVMVGKPVVKGTRFTVHFLVGLLAQGWTEKEILENYPHITRDDILACLMLAEAALKELRFDPIMARLISAREDEEDGP